MAFGAIRAAKELGLSVPDDLSVVGFDNIPFSAYYNPSLTTVGIPMYDVGVAAMEMFIHRISKKDTDRVRRFDTKLLVRDSTTRRKSCPGTPLFGKGIRKNVLEGRFRISRFLERSSKLKTEKKGEQICPN